MIYNFINKRPILIIFISLKSANRVYNWRNYKNVHREKKRIISSCKKVSSFLIKAFKKSKDIIRALIEKRNDLEIYIDCTYKFKIFLVSWRLSSYIYWLNLLRITRIDSKYEQIELRKNKISWYSKPSL